MNPDVVESGLILVAAGSGRRLGAQAGGRRKALIELAGVPLLVRALDNLAHDPYRTVVVAHADDVAEVRQLVDANGTGRLVVSGGTRRQDSVLAGLQALLDRAPDIRLVAVHDAARCFASRDLLLRVLSAAATQGCAVPGVPVTDTIRRVDDAGLGVETPPRGELRAVQTPQAFDAQQLLALLRDAGNDGTDFTDEGVLFERKGQRVRVVDGESGNRKITTPEDLRYAQWLMDRQ